MDYGCNPSATQWRIKVAHGVSRGRKCAIAKSPAWGMEFRPTRMLFRRFRFPIPQPTVEAEGPNRRHTIFDVPHTTTVEGMNAALRSAGFSPLPAINIKVFQSLASNFRAALRLLNFDLVVPQNADKVSMDAFSGVTIASHGGNDAKLKFRVRVALKRQNSINATKTKFTILLTTVVAVTVCFVAPSTAQQLIYQEGFNTDGEAANPQRYTTIGRDIYTVDRLKAEVDPATQQLGPVYWAHKL